MITIIRHFLSAIFIPIFLISCAGLSLDGAEEHMIEDCKCEGFTDVSSNFFIEEKNGSVQPCARRFGKSLKYGFVIDNDNCDTYLPFVYENAKHFGCGLAPVRSGSLWGAIDTTGKLVIPYKYEDLLEFSDSNAAYSDNSLFGFITTNGDTLVSAKYKYVSDFWADIAFVNGQNDWEIINSKGKVLPVKIDGLVESYHSGEEMLFISKGKSEKQEYLDYPFYLGEKKMKIYAFNKKYAIVPFEKDFKLTSFDDTAILKNIIKPIF